MNGDTYIIACKTLKGELELVMEKKRAEFPVCWIDAGRHARPGELRTLIQSAIDLVPSNAAVLLAFGFCGNALTGITAGDHTLVLPKAPDCISLFLGSRETREKYNGFYFLTEGHLNSGGGIMAEAANAFTRYGEKRGLSIMKKLMENYSGIAVIDTGAFNTAQTAAAAADLANPVNIPVLVIPGNLRHLEALLEGGWAAGEFLVVPSGSVISFEDSLGAITVP